MLRLPDAAPAALRGARLPAAVGLTLCLLWATSWAEAAGPTYLLAALKSIRPGANLTIGVAMLKKSPQKVTVKAEVVYANNTVLRGEAVFKRGLPYFEQQKRGHYDDSHFKYSYYM